MPHFHILTFVPSTWGDSIALKLIFFLATPCSHPMWREQKSKYESVTFWYIISKVWHFGFFFLFQKMANKKKPHNVHIRIMQYIAKPLRKFCSMSNSYVISVDKFVMGKTIKYHPTGPLVFSENDDQLSFC
jgi:hypothetical protein